MKVEIVVLVGICCGVAVGNPIHGEEVAVQPEDTYLSREMLDYLVDVRVQQELEKILGDQGMKSKRAWNRWGNKYADNKSYGFWITALNKAGNYKRGKREAAFVPGMSAPQPQVNIFKDDESNLKELIPDHDYTA